MTAAYPRYCSLYKVLGGGVVVYELLLRLNSIARET